MYMELKIVNKKGEEFIALYDDIDHELVSKHKWYIGQGYVRTWIKGRVRMLHRLILEVDDPKILVDHKNINPLDNRRDNLRPCTLRQNICNKKPRGSSKYLGVQKPNGIFKRKGKDGRPIIYKYEYWIAIIKMDGKNKYLGSFKDEIEAAKAYDKMAAIVHGEFANLNFPPT